MARAALLKSAMTSALDLHWRGVGACMDSSPWAAIGVLTGRLFASNELGYSQSLA
jgi:hypothetical protein